MNYISDILYWISTGLLVPVIVLLIILFGRSVLLLGNFFGQYLAIRKTDALLRKELDALTPETVSELGGHLSKKNNSLVVAYIHLERLQAALRLFAIKLPLFPPCLQEPVYADGILGIDLYGVNDSIQNIRLRDSILRAVKTSI